jgi:hypothetical protein
MASKDVELQAEVDASIASLPATEPFHPPARPANNWRVLLVFFVLAGIVESQAFGHLGAFTPLFLQQLNVAPADIPTSTGVLSGLGFVIGLPLLPFWGV